MKATKRHWIIIVISLFLSSYPALSQNNLLQILSSNKSSIGMGRVNDDSYKLFAVNKASVVDGYLTLDYDYEHTYGSASYRNKETLHHSVKINMKSAAINKTNDGTWNRVDISSSEAISDSYRYSSFRSNTYTFFCSSSFVADKVYDELNAIVGQFAPRYSSSESDLKKCFSELQKLFSEYAIESEEVHKTNYHASSKNYRLSLSNRVLTIQYTDTFEPGYSSSALTTGRKELRIPLSDASFGYGTNYSYSSGTIVSITSQNGLDFTSGGQKHKITSKSFSADRLIAEDIIKHLRSLKELVNTTGFNGTIGSSTPTSSGSSSSQPSQNRPSASQSSVSLPKTYNHSRYAISYPEGWTHATNIQGADVYIGALNGSIAFTVLSFPTSYTLDEVMAEANANAALAGWKKTNSSTTLCGVKCYKSTVTFSLNGQAVKQIQYTLKKNGYVYNLNFGNDATQVNANLSLISTIANSLKIK